MSDPERKIFVIEDDFTKEVRLAETLSAEGFVVVSAPATEGESVIPKIIAAKPDVVITDVDLSSPDDPLNIIEKIVGAQELKGVGLFVYTKKIDVPLEIKMRKLRLSEYFTKEQMPEHVVEGVKRFFVKEQPIEYYDPSENSPAIRGTAQADWIESVAAIEDSNAAGSAEKRDIPVAKGIDDGETSYNLGVSYMELGLLAEAAAEFEKAAADPRLRLESLTAAGVCRRKMKSFGGAIEKFKEGLSGATKPRDVMAFKYEIGVTLHEAGNLKEALGYFHDIYKEDHGYRDTSNRVMAIITALKVKQGG